MAVYEYTARDADGKKLSGIYNDVDSVAALRKELAKMGDTLLKARRKKKVEVGKRVKIKQAEVVAFAYKFAGMCSAGLPISRCLETVEMYSLTSSSECLKQVNPVEDYLRLSR
jgi:type II secretory pathway component PulF